MFHQIISLNAQIDKFKTQIAAMKDSEKKKDKELEKLTAELKRLKLLQLDESKYIQWGPDEIAAWIINLDPNRIKKYENALKKGLVENQANGALLLEVDGGDLKEWGITDRKDRKFVMAEIERLVANNALNHNHKGLMVEGGHEGPTAYM